MRQSEHAKRCIQALFSIENELLKKYSTTAGTLRLSERLANSLIGRDAFILSSFNCINPGELSAFLNSHKFAETNIDDFNSPSVDEIVSKALLSFNSSDSNTIENLDSMSQSTRRKARRTATHLGVVNPAFMKYHCPATSETYQYVGQLKESLYDGVGSTVFRNGDRYDGHFSSGQREGTGKFIWASGETYDGEWKCDVFEGVGVLKSRLFMFEGEWVNGQRTGKGRIVFESGDIYHGNWDEDVYNSEGQFTVSDGRVLIGRWHQGKLIEESIPSANNAAHAGTQIKSDFSRMHDALSMHEMIFTSQITIDQKETTSKTTKLMQLHDDTRRFREDIELAEKQIPDLKSKIQELEEQRKCLRIEESDLSSQVAEVTEQVRQCKVLKQIEDIGGKVRVLKEKRDVMVSEHTVRIIEVMMAKISHLQNLKKELQNKLTIKRYKDYMELQRKPDIKSRDGIIAELRAKVPAVQYECNQAEVELAESMMSNAHLKRNLESMLVENRSLRSQLGLGAFPKTD